MILIIMAMTVIIVEEFANVSPQKYNEARLTYYNITIYVKPRITPSGSPLVVAGLCRKSLHPP